MKVAGKCPPEPDKLQQVADHGLEYAELYLEESHLDAYADTLDACRNAPVEIVSVHTPHVRLRKNPEYIQAANDLADDLGAFLVVHSMAFHMTNLDRIETHIEFTADHGFESHPGNSRYFIENTLFETTHDFVLDTAHLYASEPDYLDAMESLFQERGDRIPLVHLCDGVRGKDGFPFGEGTMDMKAVGQLIKEHFDGIVVLEVMPADQGEALQKFKTY